VFIGLTVVIMGGAAYLTGQAVAGNWGPAWQVVVYTVLLGFVDRFLTWGLFEGDGLSVSGYLVDTAVLVALGLVAYRVTYVAKIVSQYPWLYERASPWRYRPRPES
jgi:hypothetical protein